MEFLNNWLQGIVVAVIIASIIQMILPNGNNKKYIKVVLGIYVVFQIITPVVNKFFNSNFEISSLIDIDSYTKKMETYEVSSQNTNIDKTNEDSIKQIYVANLEKDIKAKLEDKEYLIKDVEVQVEDNEKYDIKSMKIYLKEVVNSTKEESENNIHINEVEKIEIKVGQNNFNDSDTTIALAANTIFSYCERLSNSSFNSVIVILGLNFVISSAVSS